MTINTPLEVGAVYGRLTVISQKNRRVLCSCSCGSAPREYAKHHLLSGATTSCGCRRKEVSSKLGETRNLKHGRSHTPEFSSWTGMLGRCHVPTNKDYHRYGARGIYVCGRWRESFENFLADMGERPSPAHSVDRWPDNDGPYSPENCRWATVKEQARNRRNTRYVVFNGEEATLAECSERFGICGETVMQRMERGWPIEAAFSIPVGAVRGSNGHQNYRTRGFA